MDYSEIIDLHKTKEIGIQVNKFKAMHVCDKDHRIGKPRRSAHHLWKNFSFLIKIVGLVSLFFYPWYYGVGAIFLGIFMAPAVQNSAADFVSETVLESEAFFLDMLTLDVIRVVDQSGKEIDLNSGIEA